MIDGPRMSYREAISSDPEVRVIFGYELLSQPDDTLDERIPGIRHRNDVILADAEDRDIVLLSRPPEASYHSWLRSVGFSTDNVFVLRDPDGIIPDMFDDPSLLGWLEWFEGDKVYAGRYSGDREVRAAEMLGARLFGCDGDTTMRFYDKASFRRICGELGVPVVAGEELELCGVIGHDSDCLYEAIGKYAAPTGRAMIKELTSSAGANIWEVSRARADVLRTVAEVIAGGPRKLLVESMVKTVCEPNDNWAVTLEGKLVSIGISDQLIIDNMHSGNVYPCASGNVGKMLEMSEMIGMRMLEEGYVGVFGIDYLEDEAGNVFASENNSRVNGSTHAWDVVRKLERRHGEIGSFVLYQLRSGQPMTFNELSVCTGDLLYDGKKKHCFFPLDIGLMREKGAMNILATGKDYKEARGMLDTVLGRLGRK